MTGAELQPVALLSESSFCFGILHVLNTHITRTYPCAVLMTDAELAVATALLYWNKKNKKNKNKLVTQQKSREGWTHAGLPSRWVWDTERLTAGWKPLPRDVFHTLPGHRRVSALQGKRKDVSEVFLSTLLYHPSLQWGSEGCRIICAGCNNASKCTYASLSPLKRNKRLDRYFSTLMIFVIFNTKSHLLVSAF